MSTHPADPRPLRPKLASTTSQNGRLRRGFSSIKRRTLVPDEDAYSYCLRAAFLQHLLQPRAKRLQHVPPPSSAPRSATSTANELVQNFSPSRDRDAKAMKFPTAFTAELDKRITGILVGKERMPEYNDPLVKRTFATFLNEFKNPAFRKGVEKDRRIEDLLLIFFSKATSELQKGKTPGDDSWKLMVDRHVALFVRLLSSILKVNDWARDKPELATRLQDLESKLLQGSQDLAHVNGTSSGSTIEVDAPISYDLRDIPGASRVAKIFAKSYDDVQADINDNKAIWTPEAALRDLKLYQVHLNLNSDRTLNADDFDLEDSYAAWKKSEVQDLSQMMFALVQAYPQIAKTVTPSLPDLKPLNPELQRLQRERSESVSDRTSSLPDSASTFDQPDLNYLALGQELAQTTITDDTPFVFIPPDPKAYYAAVLRKALTRDLADSKAQEAERGANGEDLSLLSLQSQEVLSTIASRWRVPSWTRNVLFLDAVRDRFQNRDVDLEALDQAFMLTKQQPPEQGANGGTAASDPAFDRSKWTLTDYAQNQEILSSVHDTLLRELYDLLQQCYDPKPPTVGPVMYLLEHHIYDDPLFARTPEDLDGFSEALQQALREKARAKYSEMLGKHVPEDAEHWEFFHVIELGKAVVALADKIQKRYRKNPAVMGVSPLQLLIQEILPAFAADAKDLVERIIDITRSSGKDVPVQDGFDLYREMTALRKVHHEALPEVPFGFHIEGLLADFVWRWIALTDEKMTEWVVEAVRQDDFKPKEATDEADAQRHSSSALDMFRSFNQSIETVVELEWDDDLQYARFMTAIAKSMGAAVCKYCELLETRFFKELDPALSLDATAGKTRQEKWMQIARDTMASKDKAEPFQFRPETLVKLNNIEYTTFNLDKLEKEINADACADIIQKNTPPAPKTKRANKYVFTIKIIEAEDLRPTDMNGLSDPYVVLGDEYQKRLAKTRIIQETLNPRWEETVDIITSGPLNLIATIWDWDALGDHDCSGRTTLKLDPSHFSDFMPREIWLDLDTQGRLLLRISMEGERDDIQFYFGKTFRQLKRTERDMTRKVTDKLLAYIQQSLSPRTLRTVLGGGTSLSQVRNLAGSYWKGRPNSTVVPNEPIDPVTVLRPLFKYFDDNFAIMKQTLTDPSMLMVMTRLWKSVLITIEALLVPPLSDKPSAQKPLTSQEVDVVYKWLRLLFDFFHAEGDGIPLDVLRSPKYHDLQNLNFFYFEPTDALIRTSERMAAPAPPSVSNSSRLNGPPASSSTNGGAGIRRTKSIMLSRNLGTIKKAKEDKRRDAQAEPSDDMILRILRMRPEAGRYLKDRSRQRERLAANAAAQRIVQQSVLQSRLRQ